MSMSSMIDDLPGPQPELDSEKYQQPTIQEQPQYHQEHSQEMFTQPTMDIKKKSTPQTNVIGITEIKSEFNTFNIVLIVVLYIATIPESNDLVRKLLSNFSNVGYSHMIVTIIKCILLVVAFVIVKKLLGKNTMLL